MQREIEYEYEIPTDNRPSSASAACPRRAGGAFGLSSPTNPDAVASPTLRKPATECYIKLYVDSEYVEVVGRLPAGSPDKKKVNTRGDREAITGFSAKSRLALRREFNKLRSDSRNRCLFATVTYRANMLDGRQAKADLEALDKALCRAFPGNGFIWKMEQQKRGSIHFHLLVFGVKFIHHQWLAETWARIVAHGGPIDPDQLKAGTSIELAEKGAARAYLEKYVAKVLTLDEGEEPISEPGRYWGTRRMESFQGECIEVPISRARAVEVARTLDKLKRAQIMARWRENGKWNQSIGRALHHIRAMAGGMSDISGGSLSALLHRIQCSRRADHQFGEIGYEHCWMVKWSRRRRKHCDMQRTVWQVAITDRTAGQLLSLALS